MDRRLIQFAVIFLSTMVLFACNNQKQVGLELSLSVKLDGETDATLRNLRR